VLRCMKPPRFVDQLPGTPDGAKNTFLMDKVVS
jgi:hypothetical protein